MYLSWLLLLLSVVNLNNGIPISLDGETYFDSSYETGERSNLERLILSMKNRQNSWLFVRGQSVSTASSNQTKEETADNQTVSSIQVSNETLEGTTENILQEQNPSPEKEPAQMTEEIIIIENPEPQASSTEMPVSENAEPQEPSSLNQQSEVVKEEKENDSEHSSPQESPADMQPIHFPEGIRVDVNPESQEPSADKEQLFKNLEGEIVKNSDIQVESEQSADKANGVKDEGDFDQLESSANEQPTEMPEEEKPLHSLEPERLSPAMILAEMVEEKKYVENLQLQDPSESSSKIQPAEISEDVKLVENANQLRPLKISEELELPNISEPELPNISEPEELTKLLDENQQPEIPDEQILVQSNISNDDLIALEEPKEDLQPEVALIDNINRDPEISIPEKFEENNFQQIPESESPSIDQSSQNDGISDFISDKEEPENAKTETETLAPNPEDTEKLVEDKPEGFLFNPYKASLVTDIEKVEGESSNLAEEASQGSPKIAEEASQSFSDVVEEESQSSYVTEEATQSSSDIDEETPQSSDGAEESTQGSFDIDEETPQSSDGAKDVTQSSSDVVEEATQISSEVVEEAQQSSNDVAEEQQQSSFDVVEEAQQSSSDVTEETPQSSSSDGAEEDSQSSSNIAEESIQNSSNAFEEPPSSSDRPEDVTEIKPNDIIEDEVQQAALPGEEVFIVIRPSQDENPIVDNINFMENLSGYVYSLSQLMDSDQDQETLSESGDRNLLVEELPKPEALIQEPVKESISEPSESSQNVESKGMNKEKVASSTVAIETAEPMPINIIDETSKLSEEIQNTFEELRPQNNTQVNVTTPEIKPLIPTKVSEISDFEANKKNETSTTEKEAKPSASPSGISFETLISIKELISTKRGEMNEDQYLTMATGIFFEELSRLLSKSGPYSFTDANGNYHVFEGLGNIRISNLYVTEIKEMKRKIVKIEFSVGPIDVVGVDGENIKPDSFNLDGRMEIRIRDDDGKYAVYVNNFVFQNAEVTEFERDETPLRNSHVYKVVNSFNDFRFGYKLKDEMDELLKKREFHNLFASYSRKTL